MIIAQMSCAVSCLCVAVECIYIFLSNVYFLYLWLLWMTHINAVQSYVTRWVREIILIMGLGSRHWQESVWTLRWLRLKIVWSKQVFFGVIATCKCVSIPNAKRIHSRRASQPIFSCFNLRKIHFKTRSAKRRTFRLNANACWRSKKTCETKTIHPLISSPDQPCSVYKDRLCAPHTVTQFRLHSIVA